MCHSVDQRTGNAQATALRSDGQMVDVSPTPVEPTEHCSGRSGAPAPNVCMGNETEPPILPKKTAQ